jgi:NAD(P)-dependent dehydrogenase (short-subunit alcohol dehydrogenase family)
MLVNMTEDEFDGVVRVHLKGHFCVARHAAAYWRGESKRGVRRARAIVNTTSGSAMYGMPGQTNYVAGKAGIAGMTLVWANELERYGVRVNALSPVARTRLTVSSEGTTFVASDDDEFDFYDAANVSPIVAYLASDLCVFNGHVLYAQGGQVAVMRGWGAGAVVEKLGRWDVRELAEALRPHADDSPLGDWAELKKRRAPAET